VGPSGEFSDLSVTGISGNFANLSALASLTPDQQNNLIWNTVLAGDDTIRLGNNATDGAFIVDFAGDGRDIESGQSLHSGNDKISGDIGGGEIYGDFHSVASGSTLYAGADRIAARGNGGGYIYGDTGVVSGTVHGGDDTIVAHVGVDFVLGDATLVVAGASLFGGADAISLNSAATAYGDVNQAKGTVRGGNDNITGSSGRDQISGDVYHLYDSGLLIGGKDRIYGGRGNDTIYGDWAIADPGSNAIGGSDKLYGEGGNDRIYGNGGADLLDGGRGTDRMYGGGGADRFVFATGDGKDTIYDFASLGRNHDIIDLADVKGIDNFKEVERQFERHGKDVWIDIGHGDVIVLEHVALRDLDRSDFTF
jgi:serralysin